MLQYGVVAWRPCLKHSCGLSLSSDSDVARYVIIRKLLDSTEHTQGNKNAVPAVSFKTRDFSSVKLPAQIMT
jgi:hypothetical protein